MWHQQIFTSQANKCRKDIKKLKPSWYREVPWEEEVGYGFDMYRAASAASLDLLVLGEQALRTNSELLANVGVTAVTTNDNVGNMVAGKGGDPKQLPRGLIKEGAVLNEKFWWPFFNDCWVLGGVHGRREFHLASNGWPGDGELWDDKHDRPKMLGRELMILGIAGYSLRRAGNLGMVFYNSDHMKAFNLGFADIYALDPGKNKAAFLQRIKSF